MYVCVIGLKFLKRYSFSKAVALLAFELDSMGFQQNRAAINPDAVDSMKYYLMMGTRFKILPTYRMQ